MWPCGHVLFGHLRIFGEVSLPETFLNWVACGCCCYCWVVASLFILDTYCLSNTWFGNIFFCFFGLPFCCLDSVLHCTKVLNFNLLYFWTIRHTSPQIWEEKGGTSYSPNVAYLARGGGRGWRWSRVTGGRSRTTFFCLKFFFSYFPPLKLRCILWSGVSHSPKNMVSLSLFCYLWFCCHLFCCQNQCYETFTLCFLFQL